MRDIQLTTNLFDAGTVGFHLMQANSVEFADASVGYSRLVKYPDFESNLCAYKVG